VCELTSSSPQAERDAAESAAADEIARMETQVEVARMEKADAVEDALYLLDSERVLLERLHALEDARPAEASVKALRGEAAFLRATLDSVKEERAALRIRVSEQAKTISELKACSHSRVAEEETRKLRERIFYLEQLCAGKEAQVAGLERELSAARERGGVEGAGGSEKRGERRPSRVPFFNPRTDDIWSVAGAAMGCLLIVFMV
jgi:predicted RNase H-like nuclease (RuvC/YqgF family)